MKYRTFKKQMRRLWEATSHFEQTEDGWIYFQPAKKPLSGKSARRLIGTHYTILDHYEAGWAFCERPRFNVKRKYILSAELNENAHDLREHLNAKRAADNFTWKAGWTYIEPFSRMEEPASR